MMNIKYYEILTEILEESRKSIHNNDKYEGLSFAFKIIKKYWDEEIRIREKDADRKQETIF